MPVRHRHRRGKWLIVGDEDDVAYYSDQVVQKWDGHIVHRSQFETRQPQEFVEAKLDPRRVWPIRPLEFVDKPNVGDDPRNIDVGALELETSESDIMFETTTGQLLVEDA